MGEAPTASMGGGGVGLIAATGVEAAGPVDTQIFHFKSCSKQ